MTTSVAQPASKHHFILHVLWAGLFYAIFLGIFHFFFVRSLSPVYVVISCSLYYSDCFFFIYFFCVWSCRQRLFTMLLLNFTYLIFQQNETTKFMKGKLEHKTLPYYILHTKRWTSNLLCVSQIIYTFVDDNIVFVAAVFIAQIFSPFISSI